MKIIFLALLSVLLLSGCATTHNPWAKESQEELAHAPMGALAGDQEITDQELVWSVILTNDLLKNRMLLSIPMRDASNRILVWSEQRGLLNDNQGWYEVAEIDFPLRLTVYVIQPGGEGRLDAYKKGLLSKESIVISANGEFTKKN